MRSVWLLFLPIAVYGESLELFEFGNDDFLYHIEEDASLDIGFENSQSLSLIEIDESDSSLSPWAAEDIPVENLAQFLEKKAEEMNEEFEDVFAYEVPGYQEGGYYHPTHETIPKEKRKLFNRPKVIESARK